jgi:hypothetical protein
MFLIVPKPEVFDLQAVLLMCWMNLLEHQASRLKAA